MACDCLNDELYLHYCNLLKSQLGKRFFMRPDLYGNQKLEQNIDSDQYYLFDVSNVFGSILNSIHSINITLVIYLCMLYFIVQSFRIFLIIRFPSLFNLI